MVEESANDNGKNKKESTIESIKRAKEFTETLGKDLNEHIKKMAQFRLPEIQIPDYTPLESPEVVRARAERQRHEELLDMIGSTAKIQRDLLDIQSKTIEIQENILNEQKTTSKLTWIILILTFIIAALTLFMLIR